MLNDINVFRKCHDVFLILARFNLYNLAQCKIKFKIFQLWVQTCVGLLL